MNLIKFYKENVREETPKILVMTLTEMQKEMKRNMNKKVYMFTITGDKRFLAHKFTHVNTAIEAINKGDKIVFMTSIKPFLSVMLRQIRKEIPDLSIERKGDALILFKQ